MRINFLLSQALWNADKQRFAQAADLMEKVVAVRRVPTDWRLLADFNRASGQVEKTAEALEKALKISPLNTAQRRWLAEYNEYKNDHDAAELHRRVLAVLDSWYRARAEKR